MAELAEQVRAVVEAARAWYYTMPSGSAESPLGALFEAVGELEDALEQQVPAHPQSRPPRTWGELLAGDEVQRKDGTWMPVENVAAGRTVRGDEVTVRFAGTSGEVRQPWSRPCTARRTSPGAQADARAIEALQQACGDVTLLSSEDRPGICVFSGRPLVRVPSCAVCDDGTRSREHMHCGTALVGPCTYGGCKEESDR